MNSKKEIYRLNNNYFLENNVLLNEQDIIKDILFSNKENEEINRS